jgi:hypothetical protein
VTRTDGNDTIESTDYTARPGVDNRDPISDGVFVDKCDGWRFDAHGRHLFGASTALSRLRVRLVAGNVMVDTSTLDDTWWRNATEQ